MSIYSTNLCPEVIDHTSSEGHVKMLTTDGMWKWTLLEDVLKREADKARLHKAERESISSNFASQLKRNNLPFLLKRWNLTCGNHWMIRSFQVILA